MMTPEQERAALAACEAEARVACDYPPAWDAETLLRHLRDMRSVVDAERAEVSRLTAALDEARAGEAVWAEERRALLDVAAVMRRWVVDGEVYTREGNIDAAICASVDDVEEARAALAKVRP